MGPQDVHLGHSTCALCRQIAGDNVAIGTTEGQDVQKCQKSRCLTCARHPSSIVWYHRLCYQILASTYDAHLMPTLSDIRRLRSSTKPLYPFSASDSDPERVGRIVEEGLLSHYSKRLTEDRFSQRLLKNLPREIFVMIRDNIGLYPPLVVLGETRRILEYCRNNGDAADCSVRLELGKALYASRILFQGVWYMSKISHEMFPSAERLPQAAQVTKFTLSKDRMGICSIRFSDVSSASNDGAEWYETVESARLLSIVVELNGLFVRNIRPFPINEHSRTIDWDTPNPPQNIRKRNTYETILVPRHHNRLHYLSIVQPAGITVCCRSAVNVGIFVHTGDMNAYRRFTQTMTLRHKSLFWMFFPIHDEESLSGVWIRKSSLGPGMISNPIITIRTTRLRTMTFGPYINSAGHRNLTYHSLLDADSIVSGIFHDDFIYGYISKFGVTCEARDFDESSDLPYNRSIPIDPSNYNPPFVNGTMSHSWYMTKASLVDVNGVQYCRDDTEAHCPLLGLLIHYNDGSNEALGQFRWDRQVLSIPTPLVQFCSSERGGKPYLKDMRAIYPEDGIDDDCNWEKLSGHCAVWWFGPFGDKLLIER